MINEETKENEDLSQNPLDQAKETLKKLIEFQYEQTKLKDYMIEQLQEINSSQRLISREWRQIAQDLKDVIENKKV